MRSDAELSHLANVEDEATGEAFEVFRFTKVGGRRARLFVEREVADDYKQVRSRLRKYNADLSPRIRDSELEVQQAIDAEPSRLVYFAAATGWLADNSGFVTPYGAIDPKKRRRKVFRSRAHRRCNRHLVGIGCERRLSSEGATTSACLSIMRSRKARTAAGCRSNRDRATRWRNPRGDRALDVASGLGSHRGSLSLQTGRKRRSTSSACRSATRRRARPNPQGVGLRQSSATAAAAGSPS
jgi:hypothetical protein